MYLNHPLVPGVPLSLRYGEERDREFLAEVFTHVWKGIPEIDQAAILTRGYGRIDVDIVESLPRGILENKGGDLLLIRDKVDSYPRNVVTHLVARELARKVDYYTKPKLVVVPKEPTQDTKRRVVAILERWGYAARVEPVFTPADEERILRQSYTCDIRRLAGRFARPGP